MTSTPAPVSAAARCLLVDDDPQVRSALSRVIRSQGLECLEAGNGAEALAILAEQGEVPICITDIYMPELDGVSFLREVRQRYPDMAVLMLTGVAEVATAVECLQIGALDYIAKPVLLDEVRARVANALEKRDLVLQNRNYQLTLESRVRELDRRNRESLINGVEMLVFALEAKDAYTSGHSLRVKEFAMRTAVQLGYSGEVLAQVELGSKLHDIGKIGIREAVLNKPGALSPEEFEHIKLHTILGERILQPFLSAQPVALRIVRHHHERWDGSGFPDAVAGEAIPAEARIVAVADAYDAMTTNRAYRPSRNGAAAVEELKQGAGSQFDPDVVAAFLRAHPDLATLPVHH
ncbi:MAG TPA: HD domain-containing phosphohydrolase [Gemmatimonadales bacterium]|nr:HD domain-containing phosphohydrolase [Gemmatimonadales bacterium]